LDERNFEEDKTVHWKITALWGGKKVRLRETPRAVTPFGGLVVFFEFLRQVGYCEAVRQHLPFRLTSSNAIDPVETFTAFLLSVVAGARRFAHTNLLRADVVLHGLLGITRFPRKRWRCCRNNMRFASCAPMRAFLTNNCWGFWSSASCPTSSSWLG
jgi:hypothetical protein